MGFGMRKECYTRDSHDAFKKWKKTNKKIRRPPPLPKLTKEEFLKFKTTQKALAKKRTIKLVVMTLLTFTTVITFCYHVLWK